MNKNKLIYFLIVFSMLLILLDYIGILKPVRAPVDRLVIPAKQTIWDAQLRISGFMDAIGNYEHFNKISEENERLKKEKDELKLTSNLLQEENEKLRFQLQSKLPASYKFIPARVLSVGGEMEAAAGEKDGVRVGNTVVDGTVLIGRVSQVSAYRSKIELPSGSSMKVSVKTDRGTAGVTVGEGGKTILLSEILQKDPVFLEDKLITSGQDGFPPNLLLGRVVHITSDDVSVYKQAKIEPEVVYAKERMVFIISSL